MTDVPRVWLAQQMVRQVEQGTSHDCVYRERLMLGASWVDGVEDVSAGVRRRKAC